MSKWTERYSDLVTATRNGIIKRARDEVCVDCGKQATHRHHEDYAKPLDVIFVCAKCHIARHKALEGFLVRKPRIYNFSKIPVGSYVVIDNETITRVSPLVFHHTIRSCESFKCFSWDNNVVVFRLK